MRCAICQRENADDARFCNGCGRSLVPVGTSVSSREPRAYTPHHLAERILRSRSALYGERKQVTVLFADVKDSVALSEKVDAETWHEILDRLFEIVMRAVHRFEGTINQFTGDGVMALFGAPLAHEDHAQRACGAALRIKRDLLGYADGLKRSHGLDFAVRMGLNSGEVIVGAIGDDLRMDYTATGRTVGLAARLEGLAASGEAYLGESTASLASGYFELEPAGSFQVKGLEDSIEAFRLVGAGPLHTRLEASAVRGLSRLVGRVDEMARLLTALEEAFSGEGRVVGVRGDEGVGKSRLCMEFGERCASSGIPVHRARGISHASQIPLFPILELIRGEFGINERDSDAITRSKIAQGMLPLGEDLAEMLPMMFDFLGVPSPEHRTPRIEPEDRQRVVFDLLRKLFLARSKGGPTVVLFDDLQWIDAATESFLEQLASDAEATRMLLLLNYRPVYQPRWLERLVHDEIVLEALGSRETGQLLRDLLGTELADSPLAAFIQERARGNPFFIEEMIRSLSDHGAIVGERGAHVLATPVEEMAVPATIQALIEERIDRLPERDKEALQMAAIIGERFGRSILASVAERPEAELDASLHELIAKAFIVEKEYFPETVYAFRHPLTQEVTYDSLLKDRRLRGHADTARAYEQLGRVRGDEYASLIAHHYDRAGEALEAVQWYQRAARWARRRDPSETVRLWKRVCTLLDGVPDAPKSPILGLRARSEILAVGGWRTGLSEAEAARLFEEGQALSVRCGDVSAHARLLEAYGGARGFAGDIEALVEYVGQASKATQDEADLGRRAARYRRLMFANLHLGNLKEALALTDQLQELLPGAPEGGPDAPNPFASLELGPVAFRGLVLAGMGRAEEAEQYLSRAGRLALSPGFTEMVPVLPVLYLFSTMIAWYKGDASAADAHSAALAEYASQSHSTWDAVIAHMCQGQAQILSGRATAAARTFEAGLRLARERRVGLEGEADLLGFQAEAYLDAGDEWRGLATAAEAVRVARERKTRWWEVRAQRAYARALLLKEGRARADEADEALQRALFLVMETGARAEEPFLRMTLAELARVRGDEAGRERELSEARRLFAASGATARAAPLAAAV